MRKDIAVLVIIVLIVIIVPVATIISYYNREISPYFETEEREETVPEVKFKGAICVLLL